MKYKVGDKFCWIGGTFEYTIKEVRRDEKKYLFDNGGFATQCGLEDESNTRCFDCISRTKRSLRL